jgi:hypothetical protein
MARGKSALLTLAVMLLSAAPALAQESAAGAAQPEGAAGVTTLALLLGIGAVFVVGLVTIARERFNDQE